MKNTDFLLLKTFLLSLAIHAAGISLFAIVLPDRPVSRKPIEVSILPPAAAPEKITLAKADVTPPLTSIPADYERLDFLRDRHYIRLSLDEFMGTPELIPFTEITADFKIPDFHVEIPTFDPLTTDEIKHKPESPKIEIEGPAGERKLIYREPAEYPEWAQKNGMQGNVRLKFWVEPGGDISLTTTVLSSGFPELDIYAEQQLRSWLFEPVRTDKTVWGIITFRFRLR